MRRVSWRLWFLFAGTLALAFTVYASREPENPLTTFRSIRPKLERIDYSAPPAMTDGYRNIQETEWPFFSLTYWGYSGCNLAQTNPEAKKELLENVRWALEKLQTRHVWGFVEPHFGPAFGPDFRTPSVLFHGHFLLLALRYRELSGDSQLDPLIHTIAEAFAKEFGQEPSGVLPSYPNMWYPTDDLPALAALRLHDRIYQTHYADAPCARWVETMSRSYSDPKTGLICSYIDPRKGSIRSGPRGVALMFAPPFLRDVDPAFAKAQYALCKKYMFGTIMGLQGAREYPIGTDGASDVDSGEIVMGLGQAASGFAITASAAMNDRPFHDSLLASLKLFNYATGADRGKESSLIPLPGECVILCGKTFPFTDAAVGKR